MTYQTFHRLTLDALDCTDLDEYIAEVGSSLPERYTDDVPALIDMLRCVWEYAHDRTFATVIKLSGLSQAAFAREYVIPIRTIEDWLSNERTAPYYVTDLLALAVLGTLAAPDEI